MLFSGGLGSAGGKRRLGVLGAGLAQKKKKKKRYRFSTTVDPPRPFPFFSDGGKRRVGPIFFFAPNLPPKKRERKVWVFSPRVCVKLGHESCGRRIGILRSFPPVFTVVAMLCATNARRVG